MVRSFIFSTVIGGFLAIAIVAIAQASDADKESLTFVRSILNSSPQEVQLKLGLPDKDLNTTKDCDYLPDCSEATYKSGKFEALFYNNRLKWIQVNNNKMFDKNGLKIIGFSASPPTFESKFVHSWRSSVRQGSAKGPLIPVAGIREIDVFPDYMLITVDASYDKRFSK